MDAINLQQNVNAMTTNVHTKVRNASSDDPEVLQQECFRGKSTSESAEDSRKFCVYHRTSLKADREVWGEWEGGSPGLTSASLRFYIDLISISHRSHFDSTSASLR